MSLLFIAIAIAIGVRVVRDSPTPLESSTALDSRELSVARFMDASLGVYSPLATKSAENSSCLESPCSFSNDTARSPTQATEQLSDVQIAHPTSIDWTSTSVVDERFNVALLTSRNNLLFLDNATSNASSQAIRVGNAFVSSEAALLNGNLSSCATHNCTITSDAGASIISFENEIVNGKSATIRAIVKVWQQQAVIKASGVLGPWNIATGELNDTFSLLRVKRNWLVNSVRGSFVPGQGP
jgi:hypothetical protein